MNLSILTTDSSYLDDLSIFRQNLSETQIYKYGINDGIRSTVPQFQFS